MVALTQSVIEDGADAMGITDEELLRAYNYFAHVDGRYSQIARLIVAEAIGRRMLYGGEDE
jgi:hypothetical protein